MTTECVLLLHALDAFQNALYTTTRIYTRADYSSSSPSLYCKLRNACAYVLASRSHAFSGEGVAPRGYMWYRQSRPPNSELLPPPLKLTLYTAGSATALTGAVYVPMLVMSHAVTAGASLYIEKENLIAGKPE